LEGCVVPIAEMTSAGHGHHHHGHSH
jgi:hypothetical protein